MPFIQLISNVAFKSCKALLDAFDAIFASFVFNRKIGIITRLFQDRNWIFCASVVLKTLSLNCSGATVPLYQDWLSK